MNDGAGDVFPVKVRKGIYEKCVDEVIVFRNVAKSTSDRACLPNAENLELRHERGHEDYKLTGKTT